MKKRICVLGASGSVGSQVLEVLEDRSDYELIAFSCWNNIDFARKIINKFSYIKYVALSNELKDKGIEKEYPQIRFYFGSDDLLKMIEDCNADVYENSILGFAGLNPTFKVIELRKTLLLANKESLVIAGRKVNEMLKKYNTKMFPIDSEHVAIKKCLYGNNVDDIEYICLTASGGKFFDLTREELKNIKNEDAISHPNWNMGKKITIDSNTMMNKTFEIIEAHYLFDIPLEKIRIIRNKDSFVHGFVVFKDKTRVNVGKPTMKTPIQYALDFGEPKNNDFDDVEIDTLNKYQFDEIKSSRFPLIDLAKDCIDGDEFFGCILNAIDEVVVSEFMKSHIAFNDIDSIIIDTFSKFKIKNFKYSNFDECDKNVRSIVTKYISER